MSAIKKLFRRAAISLFGTFLIISLSHAGALIAIDSSNFDLGGIDEGSMDFVKHVFKVKNKGDSVLHIKQVRPG
ncbi:MAG: hypothetical protein PHC61_18730 [Chitinivibrionales bacterium]|nr:hypothetical protein [Chitinivibrionales bacterium]